MNNEFDFFNVRDQFLKKKAEFINTENAIEKSISDAADQFLENVLEDFKKCIELFKFKDIHGKRIEVKNIDCIEIIYKVRADNKRIEEAYCEIYVDEKVIESSNINFELTDDIIEKVIEKISKFEGYQAQEGEVDGYSPKFDFYVTMNLKEKE